MAQQIITFDPDVAVPYGVNLTVFSGADFNTTFTIKTSGYHSYFGLSSSALNSDDEFEVNEDATKTQIKSAFAKSLNSKKMNKKILGEFISLVA